MEETGSQQWRLIHIYLLFTSEVGRIHRILSRVGLKGTGPRVLVSVPGYSACR